MLIPVKVGHQEHLLPCELFGNKENPANILASSPLLCGSSASSGKLVSGLVDSTGTIISPNFLPSLKTGGLGKRAQVVARGA